MEDTDQSVKMKPLQVTQNSPRKGVRVDALALVLHRLNHRSGSNSARSAVLRKQVILKITQRLG